ncbi:MAG: NAD(P)-dependent oxidoreductase [Silicimonas sp.]|jgi:2-hydroxy-3-oxopropionate reductase|nr:NAD(P)-dependent oxidoreductase [Silicimonas sp.]
MSKPKIGFIGLGLMGSAMVGRLQDKGYELTVLGNVNRTGLDAAVARGATEAANAREVAEASDIIMLCMGTSDHVESRMRGPDGVIAGLAPGKIVIDYGTSLPASTLELGKEVAAKGASMMDAPLGRAPSHAKDGLLNIMAAGDKADFDRMEPVFKDQAENIFHLGPLGSGHTIKLMNNFYAMTTANAMSEAFAICDKAGIERKALYDVLSAGPNGSGMMDFIKAYAVDGDPEKLAFTVRNARKDIGYYAKMVQDMGHNSIMAQGAIEATGRATEEGHGDDLVPQMVDNFSRWFKD